jgi:hypothetical protein
MSKTRRCRFLRLIACGALVVGLLACSTDPATRPETARPNILFILVDDLGWADIGSFGSKLHETPNIDRLEQIPSFHNP